MVWFPRLCISRGVACRDGSHGFCLSQSSRGSKRRFGETQRARDAQCERPGTPDKHPSRTADMGYFGRDLPPRILHAARRLQPCCRTQATAWLSCLIAARFHPQLLSHIRDGGRAQNRRTRTGHVFVRATGTQTNARDESGPPGSQSLGLIEPGSGAHKVRA
jgi:hypothetical protein